MTAGPTPSDDAAQADVRAIDRRLVSGIAWTAVFYVARILTPADYGLVAIPLSAVPSFVVMGRVIDVSLSQYFAALRPAVVGCLVMAIVVLLVRQGLPDPWAHAARLGAQAGIGAVMYVGVLLGFYRSRVTDIYRVIREARHA